MIKHSIKALLVISIIILFQSKTKAQEKNIYMYGEELKPTILVVCKPAEKENILLSINKMTIQNQLKIHYVFITDTTTNKESLTVRINKLLNTELWFDKYQLYLLTIGDTTELKTFKALDKKVFAESHFQSRSEPIDEAIMQNIITKFQKKYLWLLDLEKIEVKGKQEVFQRKDWSLGFVLGWNWQNSFTQDSAYLPSFITKYGVLVDYKLSNHFHLNGKLLMSFNIPSQSKIQSEIQSQINPLRGGVQTVSAEMALHIFVQPSLQLNYFYNLKKSWQSFAGIGISAISFSAARKKISQTIDLSNSGGAGGFGGGNLGNANDLVLNTGMAITPYIAFGFSKNLSINSSIYVSGDYFFHTTNQTHKGVRPTNSLDNLSIQTGFMFRLGKKAKYFYTYLN